jgi:DNA-binding MarR family transcriptional regulator
MPDAKARRKAVKHAAKTPSFEDHVAVRIVRISEILQRLATRKIEARWGLRNTDLRILNILDGEESVAVSEVGRRTHVDKAWISRSIRQLMARGLVMRSTDPKDSRLSMISLSSQGEAILEEIRPYALRNEKQLLKGLKAGFKRDLELLLRNAEESLEDG